VVAAVGGTLLLAVAVWLARTCPNRDQRRFLLWSAAMVVVMTVLFTYYAWRDIDEFFAAYEGYFFWAAPLLLLLTTVAGITASVPPASWRFVVPVLTAGTIAFAVAASLVPMPRMTRTGRLASTWATREYRTTSPSWRRRATAIRSCSPSTCLPGAMSRLSSPMETRTACGYASMRPRSAIASRSAPRPRYGRERTSRSAIPITHSPAARSSLCPRP